MGQELYPWQRDCLERWLSAHGRGIVQAATGTGKTRLALAAIGRLQEQWGVRLKIKIIVPTGALMRQWSRALRETGEEGAPAFCRADIGMRGGGFQTSSDRRCVIYVINSARYELARQILADLRAGDAVLLIADECHRYISGQNRLIFEFLPYLGEAESRFFSLGLSATLPVGTAQSDLTSVLGRVVYRYGMAKAAQMQTVCPYDLFHISVCFQKRERSFYQELTERIHTCYRHLLQLRPSLRDRSPGERFEQLRMLAGDRQPEVAEAAAQYLKLVYRRKSLVCTAAERTECACELVRRIPSWERILIFGERISQAEALYQMLRHSMPGQIGRYHSQMGRQANQNALNRFQNGEIRILITCRALDEGIDIPDASVGIILSGTSMQRQRIQRLGRIIRKRKGKERAILYYLHIENTAEDSRYLLDEREGRVTELEYRSEQSCFSNPSYDLAAGRFLEKLETAACRPEQYSEAIRCLKWGSIRMDWLRDGSDLEERLQKASYISERNYWFCMKQLRQISAAAE